MYNLIGNSCVSAFITNELLKQKYINPFCWCTIDADSMYNLIKYYDNINFKNFELIKDKNWMFYIIIDKKIKIRWPHYKFSKTDKILKKLKHDVYWNKIWEYIVEIYIKRTNRMLNEKINPIFIIGSTIKSHLYNENKLKQICALNSKYKLIICNNNMDFSNEFPNIIFHKTDIKNDNFALAKEIFNNYNYLF
jgi:hypothetical protein